MSRFIIHIGAHKCGSKFMQTSLRRIERNLTTANKNPTRDRDAQDAPGVAIHTRPSSSALEDFRAPFLDLRKLGDPQPSSIRRAETFVRQCASDADTIIISDETLLGRHNHINADRLYPDAQRVAELFRSLLRGQTVDLSLIIRRQDTLIESWFMQRINEGRNADFSKFTARLPLDSLHWGDVADRVVAGAGRDTKLRVIPLDLMTNDPQAFFHSFLAQHDLPTEWSHLVEKKQVNSSLSSAALAIVRRAYPLMEKERRVELRKVLQRILPASAYGRATLLSDEERSDLIEQYQEDNASVLRKYGSGAAMT